VPLFRVDYAMTWVDGQINNSEIFPVSLPRALLEWISAWAQSLSLTSCGCLRGGVGRDTVWLDSLSVPRKGVGRQPLPGKICRLLLDDL